jgi:tRNA modification GTPase
LDFSDEDVEFAKRDEFMALLDTIESELKSLIYSFDLGNALRNGIPVTIIGKPNVGKSTLLNCLLDEDKAIVSDIPGTTRDIVEDVININGYVFRFIDTAGLHKTDDVVENMGIERTMEKIKNAKIILHVVDATNADRDSIKREMTEFQSYLHEEASSPSSKKWVVVVNKIDKAGNMGKHIQCTNGVCDQDVKLIDGDNESDWIFISAKKGENIKAIIDLLCDYVKSQDIDSRTIVTNVRHVEAMREALAAIQSACKGFEDGIPTDLVAIDVHQASYSLGSIIGEISNNELLDSIFGHFCIGK